MSVQAKLTSEVTELDLSLVCCLDDAQPFYNHALLKHVRTSAARYLATLYLLSHEGQELAGVLLKQCDDEGAMSHLFLRCRELEAVAQSLSRAYTAGDVTSTHARLIDLYALLAPLDGSFNSNLLSKVNVTSGSFVHFPMIASTAVIGQDNSLSAVIGLTVNPFLDQGASPKNVAFRLHNFTHSGIRLSVATSQPSATGDEFRMVERGRLSDSKAVTAVRMALNGLASLDLGLAVSAGQIMKLFTVCPRAPGSRQAGSVSALPGWAWQDVDLMANPLEEHCHLSVQVVHEFFHTKVNLVEQNACLYLGDGQSPEVFSPWKNKKRPLRQVIHALLTFSAGAAVWAKLVASPWIDISVMYHHAEAYWTETMGFADAAYQGLMESEALTDRGVVLVEACVENLRSVVERGRDSLCSRC